tara:strand:- start:71 stop:637 length:567 start_codon:yes stop_codon:yes gene_type:complete
MISQLKSLFLATLAFGTAAALQAGSFTYSYTFQDGDVVSGSFNGTQSGNLITGLSDISLFFNGVAATNNPMFGTGWSPTNNSWVSGGAVASIDGTQNNFLFIDSNYPNNGNFTQYFYVRNGFISNPTHSDSFAWSGNNGGGLNDNVANDNPFIAANWSINGANVPDAATTLPLAVLGMGFLLLARRRS